MQRKPGVKCLYIRGYDVTHAEFKTLEFHNFVKTDQNAMKLCANLFLQKVKKDMP